MTLRHRLLLLYLMVVLMTLATVGVALVELRHSRQVLAQLRYWDDVVLKVQKLRTAFERDTLLHVVAGQTPPPPEDADFATLLAEARQYLDFDLVRWAMNVVHGQYSAWQELAARLSAASMTPQEMDALTFQTAEVRQALNQVTRLLENKQNAVLADAQQQSTRTRLLLVVVLVLTLIHALVVGWLLRRWLLRPMERLNRQVEALARDAPPDEPLVSRPLEMANLAQAMDRARQSLGELRRQLIESERLTTIGQLAAQLAHNLRNPLASIRATAQLVARHEDAGSDLHRRMNEVITSVDRLNRWIAGLMEVAKAQPMPVRRMDVMPVLSRVRDGLAAELAAKDLRLILHTPSDELVCEHDPATLEHALVAMVINAIEASPLGSMIELRTETFARENICRISVMDAGNGLPADHPERIFELPYSTKQWGMGLGLALARQALQRQGGTAHARNNPAGGAIVYVELPLGSGENTCPGS